MTYLKQNPPVSLPLLLRLPLLLPPLPLLPLLSVSYTHLTLPTKA